MLTRLILRDFVIAERAEIEFADGFCVLTGETGAGKSLLVGALTLLSGERASTGVIRAGRKQTEIEAAFTLAADSSVRGYLREHDLTGDEEDTLIVRRVIGSSRSVVYINGRQALLSQLSDVMAMHIDICGQHAHYSLRKSSAHRELLDSYAGADKETAPAVAAAYQRWRDADARHSAAAETAQQAEQKRIILEDTLAELAALEFTADKWRDLNDTLTRTANLSDLADGGAQTLQLLQGSDSGAGDDSAGARAMIAQARKCLGDMARHDDTLSSHFAALDDADALLADVARDIGRYSEELSADPQAQAQAEDFVAACHRVARKHGVPDPAQLDEFTADQQAALDALPSSADVEALAEAAREARAALDERCQVLSEQRQRAAETLCADVNALLAELAMPNAAISVQLTPQPAPTAHGAEKVVFQIVTRAGAAPGDIASIASGGELSRLGLAIQLAAGRVRSRAVSVFDEVDAGIGGATAGVVGALLRRLGGSRQVLCVTHLPQVSAQAHRHWRVGGGDKLAVTPLSTDERVEEIARMQSGETITDAARQHAREMLATD